MGKPAAQRMREYRMRKKNNPAYVIKEQNRQRLKYVKSKDLTKRKLNERRKRVKNQVARCRERKRKARKIANDDTYVNIPRNKRKFVTKFNKTVQNKNNVMKCKLAELNKKHKALQKKVQRLSTSTQKQISNSPLSSLKKQLGKQNLQNLDESVRKKLLFGEILTQEFEKCPMKRSRFNKSREIIKKYRLMKYAGKRLHTNTSKKRMKYIRQSEHRDRIYRFFNRPDNVRILPGKKDYVSVNGEKLQKMIVTDFLHNLHQKYNNENHDDQISLATFGRMRPRNVLPVDFTSKNTCLCTYHQNFAMKLGSLSKLNIFPMIRNPEDFINKYSNEEIKFLSANHTGDVDYEEWAKVTIETPKGPRQRTQLVRKHVSMQQFIDIFINEYMNFRGHVHRATTQIIAYKQDKESLHDNEILVHMDFAENYVCVAENEVQSAHWNSQAVTIHPCVIYYKSQAKHSYKSLAIISDTREHNANTVYCILKKIIAFAKETISPDLKTVNYWTDGPSSQYRNYKIFSVVFEHQIIFHCDAVWNYFEVGHGKGPCDGVGGSLKRNADRSVKLHKAVIQDAQDFFAWGMSQEKSEITFTYISHNEIAETVPEFQAIYSKYKTVAGTQVVSYK